MNLQKSENRDFLIENNLKLVYSLAKRFIGRYEFEDLVEVGKIGLIKAIDSYDESLGYSLSTFAYPHILGEIKRFLRDDGIIKVSRQIKKNSAIVANAKEEFIKCHGYMPKISELCAKTNLSQEDVLQALEAMSPIMSLHETIGKEESDLTVGDTIADKDMLENIIDSITLRQAFSSLSEDEKQIISLRYFRNFTQSKVAKVLGVSQVTISRAEKKILNKLRKDFLGIM